MRRHPLIRAAADDTDFVIAGGTITIEAAAADGRGPRKIEILAYTGGLLHLPNYDYPVVVDLAGLTGTNKARPILKDHNRGLVVGHTTKITNDGRQITAVGVASGTGPAAKEVLSTNDNGFPWQASIGAKPLQREFVPPGRQVSVNGQSFEGPLILARRTRLGEISFVVLGADDDTSARIAAGAAKDNFMTFDEWLKAHGFDADGLSDAQSKYLRAQFDAEIQAAAADNDGDDDGDGGTGKKKGKGKTKAQPKPKAKKKVNDAITAALDADADDDDDDAITASADDLVTEQRKRLVAERRRVAALASVETKYSKTVPADKFAEITANAIEEEWSVEKLELALIRAERPHARGNVGGGTGSGPNKLDAQVIEASLSLTAGVAEKAVGESIAASDREQVMNKASSSGMRGYSLHALMDAVIHAAGMHHGGSRKTNDYIRCALQAEQMINASSSGFTSLSLSGILSNVANKGLIAAYTAVEVVWNQIAAVRSHGDFKVHTRYRLDSTGAFKKVAADGELKHVGLDNASYTNQVNTFGAIIALTRQMMINDDLGAFMDIPTLLGRLAALRLEEALFVLLLANTGSFFSTGNRNLLTGASSALSIASIATVEKKFRDQTDSNNKPVLVSPTKILTGTTLASDAQNIFDEKVILASSLGSTSSRVVEPAKNKMYNKYKPVSSPYVDNTNIKDQDGAAITGQSASLFWMFADPAVRAALAVAFLNSQQTPTIESAQTDFNTLGMQWRAYHDFGVGFEDPNAAVQSNGV